MPTPVQLEHVGRPGPPAADDLCICLELADHLPALSPTRLCRLQPDTVPTVVMAAA